MKILFVENHAEFARTVIAQFLSGHDTQVAGTIREATALLATTRFDVVLCDFDLDDGKGSEFVRWIRDQRHPVKVIAISSHHQGNEALLAAGADSLCPKTHFHHIARVIRETVVQRVYKAIVWQDPERPGVRREFEANTLEEAENILRREFGKDAVISLWNEEDADRPR